MIFLHTHGSGNPLGITGNADRVSIHPYYTFKDLITIFLYFILLGGLVFYAPNLLGEVVNYEMANPLKTPPAIVPE
jgi:quinol-cytochrome oxidoreductase complex cytochrome b subunit